DFFKANSVLEKKKNLSAKKIRGVLKKSYSKNSLPSIKYIMKLMGSSGKKVQKKNHRALASSIVDYIYARTLKLNGLESSKKLRFRLRRLKKSPLLTEFQKLKRLIWCLQNQNNQFENYIFVDEVTIIV
ncbi:hypothetical protein BpHYR1_011579, partial [Brachionus plicatilis]